VDFLQQNRFFVIVVGLAVLATLVLWPSLFGLGPAVVSLDRSRYDGAKMGERSLEGKMNLFYPKTGKGVPIKDALRDLEASNQRLGSNLDEARAWMTFVPRFPFRIPEPRKDAERNAYVSLAYAYLLYGELFCDECTIRDENDGVVSLCGKLNIPLRDPFLGMPGMAVPGGIKDPDIRIAQVALVHELCQLAIRLNPDEITAIIPAEPYKVRLNDVEVAVAYPLTLRFKCHPTTLLALLHALDGAHGRVSSAPGGAEEPADAIKPLVPERPKAPDRPKADPAAEPDDPGPAPAPAPAPAAADAADAPSQKLVIQLGGDPSYLSPDASQGTLKERFTIFRRDPASAQKFLFVANAVATKVLDPASPKLAPESVLSWRGLCGKLKAQSGDKTPSPGKRLWELLPENARTAIQECAQGKELDPAQQADLLSALNEVLAQRRDFHHPDDFSRTALPAEAANLLKLDRQGLSPGKLAKLNRLLLEAAFPQEIAKAAIRLEAAVEKDSDVCLQPDGKAARNVVREGDFASTRFFLVCKLRVKSAPGVISRDTTAGGLPTDVIAPHVEVDLGVAALSFLEIQAVKPVEAKKAVESAIIHRGY